MCFPCFIYEESLFLSSGREKGVGTLVVNRGYTGVGKPRYEFHCRIVRTSNSSRPLFRNKPLQRYEIPLHGAPSTILSVNKGRPYMKAAPLTDPAACVCKFSDLMRWAKRVHRSVELSISPSSFKSPKFDFIYINKSIFWERGLGIYKVEC